MTILSVWAISCAQRVASSSASGGALREAKNATKGLSNKSLFPDKSIKKAQAAVRLPRAQGLRCPSTRISDRQPTPDVYTSIHYAINAVLTI